MCEWGTTVPMPLNGRVRDIDSCLALLIATLNTIPALETSGCCCGHGKMPGSVLLKDGSALVVMTREQHDAYFAVPGDKERLDLLEELIRGSAEGGWVEVYLSGLRHGVGPADAFQVETNPNHLGTVSGPTLREGLDALKALVESRATEGR